MNSNVTRRSVIGGMGALGALALSGGLGAVLEACGGGGGSSSTPAAPSTLDFPSWQLTEPGVDTWLKNAIAAYHKAHPKTTIDGHEIPFKNYVDTLTTRFSAKKPPDIVHLPTRNFAQFASQGWLDPIDDLIGATDIGKTWTPLQKSMRWDGKTQGVLLLGYGYVLYYNDAMLQKAGVKVPTSPKEMIAAAKALTGNGVYGFGAATAQHPNIIVDVTQWIVGEGHDWVKNGGYAFTDPGVVAAVDDYRKVIASAPKGVPTEQARTLFFDGKIAMLIDGPFVLAEKSTAAAGVQPHIKVALPPFPHVPGAVSNSLHIPAGASAGARQAAWEFIKMLTTPDWQRQYASLYKVPPPRKGVLDKAITDAVPELALFSQATDKAVNVFPTDKNLAQNYSQLAQMVGDAMLTLMSTSQSTSSVLADLQSKVKSQIGNP